MGKRDFFAAQQGAAVFKHGAFRRYTPKFAGKLGMHATDHRVVICDGYAGPGRYDDGTQGSPLIVAEIASRMPQRRIELICVEKEPAAAAQLEKELAAYGSQHLVLEGTFEDRIDDVLQFAGESPMLAILDPFGMGAPMEKLQQLLDRDPRAQFHVGPPTEILMNFSFSGLRRNAGHLTSHSTYPPYLKARLSILEQMDSWMGDDWWRDIWASAADSTEERVRVLKEIVDGYLSRLARGRAWYISPAADRWDGPAVYLLALFTQSDHGLWEFNDALSYAREDFYGHTHRDQLQLDPFPGWREEWKQTIAANIEGLLARGPVRLRGEFAPILGNALGWARGRDIRAAIKFLHAQGKTPTTGVGKLFGMVILPP